LLFSIEDTITTSWLGAVSSAGSSIVVVVTHIAFLSVFQDAVTANGSSSWVVDWLSSVEWLNLSVVTVDARGQSFVLVPTDVLNLGQDIISNSFSTWRFSP
jgi:hypothetical protein